MGDYVAENIDLRGEVGWIPEDSFENRLALVRTHKNWNAARADRECGFGKNSWQRWEDGTKPYDYEDVCWKIAKASGCNLNWLTYGGPLPSRSRWGALKSLRLIPGGSPGPAKMNQLALPLFAQIADN